VDLISGRSSQQFKQRSDIERVSKELPSLPPSFGMLAIITNSTAHASNPYMWTYEWTEALVGANDRIVAKTQGLTGVAFSISELGNYGTSRCSYGVIVANIPAGFAPVKIHTSAAVWIVPTRRHDTSILQWLIVNTQAIDGICPP
jgi:hypothetical protein